MYRKAYILEVYYNWDEARQKV